VNHLFFTSNPPKKPSCQTHSHSAVPGNVSTSAAVVDPSVQPAVAPKSLPPQSKSSKKKKTKGDNVVMLSSPASATTSTSTALLPSAPKSLPEEKKWEQIICLAKALKAASPRPLPVVVAPKEAGTALAPMVSTALDTLPERNALLDVDDSTSDTGKRESSSNSNSLSLTSLFDDDS